MPRQIKNIVVVAFVVLGPLTVQLLSDGKLGQRYEHITGREAPESLMRLNSACELGPYQASILYKMGLNVTLAVGLSLIIGFAGQFSLGQAAFMSLGAFSSGMLTSSLVMRWTSGMDAEYLDGLSPTASLLRAALLVFVMVAGIMTAAIGSIIVGLPALRLRGDYLAIATLGFGEITFNLLLIFLQRKYYDTAFYMPSQVDFMVNTVNVASSWILALTAILVVRNLVSSTSGRALPAIREDEIASSSVGIQTTRYKMLAFVVGSMLAGGAGVLEAHQTLTVNPASYRFDRSIEMLVPVVLGGSGSLTGSVLAAAGFTYLLERLRELPSGAQQYRTIVYASALILLMILRPQGLMGRWELRDLWKWASALRRQRKPLNKPSPTALVAVTHVSSSDPSASRLECRNLTIRFGGLTAVQNFNLALDRGEIIGLIGPNGAGKTTCFNMITGHYRPTDGDIRFAGRSIVGRGPTAINRAGIARTFQNIRLFSNLSVLDNVRIALHAHLRTGIGASILRTPSFYREETEAYDTALALLDVFGLAEVAEETAGALPYGGQRRLEIARALATRPKLLCLDEPAAGTNPSEKQELMDLIRRIRDQFQIGVLLIEHDMKVVMNVCERILVLDHGETIAEGPPAVIQTHSRVIEAYLGEPQTPAVALEK